MAGVAMAGGQGMAMVGLERAGKIAFCLGLGALALSYWASSPARRLDPAITPTSPASTDPAPVATHRRADAAVVATDHGPGFVFRTQELPFRYDRGESGAFWPVEPIGGGVGMLDFDGDGDLDLFFAQGVPLPVGRSEKPPADVLLRNDGNRRFVDVSATAGLTSKGHGEGVTVADYDGDGDPDVYVTRYGPNTLWRNDKGRFTDVTAEAGVGCPLWSLGAAFGDYDGDGDLDLFVANYFHFDPAKAPFYHEPGTGRPGYGSQPTAFDTQPAVLYRNDGDGRFTDVTTQAKVASEGRGMGVLAADIDGDGRVEFLVANDLGPNAVWRARADGTLEDVATDWGLAYNDRGQVEANMGIAFGDVNADGAPDVLISHYYNEHHTLWCAQSAGGMDTFFLDVTYAAGLGVDSRPTTGWGAAFADFDQDGALDLVVTNGHIRPEPQQRYRYENPPLLWRNTGCGRFVNVTATGGDYFRTTHQGRGLAAGDLDGDGDLDLVIVQHHAPSVVLWNETPNPGHWLLVDLTGLGPNRDAVGARVTATVGGRTLVRTVDNGGSYLSSNDRRVHFGLGRETRVDRLDVRWPSGRVEARKGVPADQVVRWREGDPGQEN